MAGRFASVDNEGQQDLANKSQNKNTLKSTNLWLNAFKEWAVLRNKESCLEKYETTEELDKSLSQFYGEVRKQDGKDYEPDCLRVMQGAFHRHLRGNQSPFNILTDMEFLTSRNVLEGKARTLRAMGMGKRPNASDPLSKKEEELLWEIGRLGDSTPTSLVRTMWFNNTQFFGLRGVQEHVTMTMENFAQKVTEDGTIYIKFSEDVTKTRQEGLKPTKRPSDTKFYAVGGKRCPVRLFQLYVSKRPRELRNTGRFYLTPRRDKSHLEWYVANPMGKNTISSIMKNLVAGTELANSEKKNYKP